MGAYFTSSRRRYVAIATLLAQVAALVTAFVMFGGAAHAGPSAVMFGYVPMPANDFDGALRSISAASTTQASTTVDFTVEVTNAAAGAVINYDQWEDGYEADISNPSQATTLVLGDGNTANGDAGTYCGARCAGDVLPQGAALVFRNNITTPRDAATQLFDGGDKIASTRGFTITAGGFPTNVGSLLAGVVSSYDTTKYATDYTVPVGENTPVPSGTSNAFGYTGLIVQASSDGTVVNVDKDANGTTDVTQTINEGKTVFVDGGVKQGATVRASKPVQVHLVTGDKTASYESRTFTLFPDNLLSNDYMSPAGANVANFRTVDYLYNPTSSAITVTPTCAGCSSTINVPAKASAAFQSPVGQAVEFTSAAKFVAVAGVGAQSGAAPGTSGDSSSSWDWGYTMVPVSQLTTQVVLGWAPGNSTNPPGSAAASDKDDDPVWVTSTSATTINVDFDGDPSTGTITGNDCFGAKHDLSIPVAALASTRITDASDEDMTGARIYTCDGTRIAGAWGEDPQNAPAGSPGFDAGYTIIPSTTMLVNKTSALAHDANGDGKFGPGDTMTYDIEIADAGSLAFTNVKADDTLPGGLTYVPGSTVFDDGSTQTPIADDNAPPAATVFPLDETGISLPNVSAGATVHLRFQAAINDPFDTSSGAIGNTACVTAQEASACDSVTTNLVQSDLSLGVTQTASPQYVGDNGVFHVAVTNGGPDTATAVDVADGLPANTSFVSSSASQGSYDSNSGVWNVGTIANGETKTLDITAKLDTTSVEDFAQVTAAQAVDPDSQPAEDAFGPGHPANQDDEGSVVVNVSPSADLGVAKTLHTAPSYVGDNAVYDITVTNHGPSDATGIAVTDMLPAGMSYVSDDSSGAYNSSTGVWTVGAVANGASRTLLITTKVNAIDTLNTASISASGQHDPDSSNNSSSKDVTVAASADLAVAKTLPTAPTHVGDNAVYKITLTNNGPSDATGVAVTDQLPAGVSYVSDDGNGAYDPASGVWTIGSVANAGSKSLDITAKVNVLSADNTASISASDTYDPDASNNSSSKSVTVSPSADLGVVKSLQTTPTHVGDSAVYKITVTNHGPSDATGVAVTDQLPAGMSYVSDDGNGAYDRASGVWTVGSLTNGAAKTLDITVTVNGLNADNTASVSASDQYDPDSSNNSSSKAVTVAPLADLSLSETVSPGSVTQHNQATYTITLHNSGPSDATGIVVHDTMPSGVTFVGGSSSQPSVFDATTGDWSIASLANGDSISQDIIVNVDTLGSHVNGAEVKAVNEDDPDSTPNNHVASEDDQASADVAGTPLIDLSVSNSASAPSANVGTNETYTVTVSNGGPSDATGVTVRDTLPSGLHFVSSDGAYDATTGIWNVGALANAATQTLHITAQVTSPGQVVDTAEVWSAGEPDVDSTPANSVSSEDDQASATVDGRQIDLSVALVPNATKIDLGKTVMYTMSLHNAGPSDATGVNVKDLVPSGLAFVSSAPAQGTYSPTTNVWSVGNVANGQTIVAQITATVVKAQSIVDTAQVWTADQPDVDSTPANGVSSEDDQASATISGIAPKTPTAPKLDPAGVSGSLWLDTNGNGKADPDEPMLKGVTVNLVDGAGKVVATAVTDDSGHYSFANVAPGTYTIEIVKSSLPSSVAGQSYDPDATMNDAHTVTLGSGSGVGGVNFGYKADDPPAGHVALGPVRLPITGANLERLAELGGVLILAGAFLIAINRRRRKVF